MLNNYILLNILTVAAAYQYFPDSDSSSSDEDYAPAEDWKKVCDYFARVVSDLVVFSSLSDWEQILYIPRNRVLVRFTNKRNVYSRFNDRLDSSKVFCCSPLLIFFIS
jgi:hypothetical protein